MKTTQVDIGVLLGLSTIHYMQSFHDLAYPRFAVDVKRKCLLIYFKVGIRGSETADVTQHDYRVKITFLQLTQVYDRFDVISKQHSLLIVLNSPAICHRKASDAASTLTEGRSWNEEESWYRQTSVTHNPNSLRTLSTKLKKVGHIIDFGKWHYSMEDCRLTSVSQQGAGMCSKSHSRLKKSICRSCMTFSMTIMFPSKMGAPLPKAQIDQSRCGTGSTFLSPSRTRIPHCCKIWEIKTIYTSPSEFGIN